MFQRFPSLTRFSHDWTITEKIDGTNACVFISPIDDPEINHGMATGRVGDLFVFAQSRNNIITPAKDNAGFARWVSENVEPLVEVLGEGRHFGEWCGSNIQRTYGLKERRFALFNTHRWGNAEFAIGTKGGNLAVVPVLYQGYADNPGAIALNFMEAMKQQGSFFVPGFMNPEGVVMRHGPSGTTFKKTYDYDEQGKWAENQARKVQNNG